MLAKSNLTHNLNQKILPGLVTLGRYSADVAGLTVATPSNKIIIYDLNKIGNQSESRNNVRILNFSQPITQVEAVRLKDEACDVLLVSTRTSVYLYDVDRNADVFTREVIDGANAVAHGFAGGPGDVIFVGGNCSVQGFDRHGNEVYWIVTGDNVRSIALIDVDNDGENELIVGSDDYDIRVFKKEDLVNEITETQIVTHLHGLGTGIFAYALANGTVGVYERLNRLWRVKSKNRATCLLGYDFDGDGTPELVTGWQGGKVDGRNLRTGEVLFKDNFDHTVAGICAGNCRDSGRENLIVVSITGEMRSYDPQAPKALARSRGPNCEEETVRDLLSRKQALLLELKKYEYNSSRSDAEVRESRNCTIPAKTRLQTSLGINLGCSGQVPRVEVNLSTNNDTVVRAVIIFAEGIFKDETHVKHPKQGDAAGKLSIFLYPPRDVPIDIHIKAFIGYPESKQFHVFELTRQLPRFSMYAVLDKPTKEEIISNVVFFVNERIQRVILWINRNFLLSKALDSNTYSDLTLHFLSLRDGKELAFLMDPSGKITIRTDNIVLAGDLVQSLASYLNVEQLKSVAHFPQEEENCVGLQEKLRELEAVKRNLNQDLGNKSNLIRNFIVRGEDARLLNDSGLMRKFYGELNEMNCDLRNGFEIRVNNYKDIVNAIKDVNGIVQKASRLRFGKCRSDPMSLAKNAMSSNNSNALIKVIRTGEL